MKLTTRLYLKFNDEYIYSLHLVCAFVSCAGTTLPLLGLYFEVQFSNSTRTPSKLRVSHAQLTGPMRTANLFDILRILSLALFQKVSVSKNFLI